MDTQSGEQESMVDRQALRSTLPQPMARAKTRFASATLNPSLDVPPDGRGLLYS
jgi:hypothetical protein